MAGKGGSTILKQKSESNTTAAKETRVEFSLNAPQARQVSVAGTFNRWNTTDFKLTKDRQGNWKGSLSLKPRRHQYRYFVDGGWAENPQNQTTIQNEFGSRNILLEVR